MDCIDELYSRHEVVHLLFSAGKDSTCCLHQVLEKGLGARTVLVFVNTGAAVPEIMGEVESYRNRVRGIVYLKSDQPGFIRDHGFPSDVVVSDNTELGRSLVQRPPSAVKVCDKFSCCCANIWEPLERYLGSGEVTAFIIGDKLNDKHGRLDPSGFINGRYVERCHPIANWSDAQVRSYLEVTCPNARFALDHSSIDCWNCTGYWDSAVERITYLREHHPILAERASELLKQVRADVKAALKDLEGL